MCGICGFVKFNDKVSEHDDYIIERMNHKLIHRGPLINTWKHVLGKTDAKHVFIPHDIYLTQDIPLSGVAHQVGTVRFGTDPATSVLDTNCKAHDVDNLYVVDGSFFPSIGAVNPSLTIIANAMRVGDHLIERWKT
jgi:choline dehydrogenase-like flavoprotein